MRIRRQVVPAIVLAACAVIAVDGRAYADAQAIDVTTPGGLYDGSVYVLGFEFTPNGDQTITALGTFDANGGGPSSPVMVGIWDTSGDLLDSATVPAGTGGVQMGDFWYESIAPFALVNGQDYIVGSYNPDEASSYNTGQGGAGSVNPAITIIQDQFVDASNFQFPSSSDSDLGGAWLGANFLLGAAAAPVPEPASLALLGAGLAAFAFARRRKAE